MPCPAVAPVEIHTGSHRLKMTRVHAAPTQPVAFLGAVPRRPAAKVIQLSGLGMGADEQQVHQTVDEIVSAVHKAVGVSVLVDAAGP